MKKIGLRCALNRLGCTVVELHWNGGCVARDQSGFFYGTGLNGFADGQLYYVVYSPHFEVGGNYVMYRTAKDTKDFTGGTNCWDFEQRLRKIDYQMDGKVNFGKSRW